MNSPKARPSFSGLQSRKRLAGRYDLSEIQAGREDDPQLQSGDVIVVPTSDTKVGANYLFKGTPSG